MTAAAASGWEGILEQGETILWQGRPDTAVDLLQIKSFNVLFGLAYAGFALFWMSMSAAMVWSGPMGGGPFALFPLFGLPFFVIGLNVMGGKVFWDAYRRRRTWYTLTDRRAFEATSLFGIRRLRSVPVEAATPVERLDVPPDSIRIGPHVGDKVIFQRLPDMSEPYRHLRAIRARSRRA